MEMMSKGKKKTGKCNFQQRKINSRFPYGCMETCSREMVIQMLGQKMQVAV